MAFPDHRLWQRQVADLSDEFTVIAWDAPGCGTSTEPDHPFGLTDDGGREPLSSLAVAGAGFAR